MGNSSLRILKNLLICSSFYSFDMFTRLPFHLDSWSYAEMQYLNLWLLILLVDNLILWIRRFSRKDDDQGKLVHGQKSWDDFIKPRWKKWPDSWCITIKLFIPFNILNGQRYHPDFWSCYDVYFFVILNGQPICPDSLTYFTLQLNKAFKSHFQCAFLFNVYLFIHQLDGWQMPPKKICV